MFLKSVNAVVHWVLIFRFADLKGDRRQENAPEAFLVSVASTKLGPYTELGVHDPE